MDDGTRAMRRAARTAVGIAAAVAAALLAACGGSPPRAGGAAGPPSAIAYSACVRSHGVPNFPDPTNGGPSGPVFNITKAGISDAASHTSRFDARLTECGRVAGASAPESFE